MKKFFVLLLTVLLLICIFSLSACGQPEETGKEDATSQKENGYSEDTVKEDVSTEGEKEDVSTEGENAVEIKAITITCGNNTLQITLADTVSADAFVERLKQGDVTVSMREYGGFEMVGGLGFSLEREDEQMTTNTGDVVLYGGNSIVIFYGSNSWAYTKIGTIKNISRQGLVDFFGTFNNVDVVFSL